MGMVAESPHISDATAQAQGRREANHIGFRETFYAPVMVGHPSPAEHSFLRSLDEADHIDFGTFDASETRRRPSCSGPPKVLTGLAGTRVFILNPGDILHGRESISYPYVRTGTLVDAGRAQMGGALYRWSGTQILCIPAYCSSRGFEE
jgi:hypothetical protein